MNSILQFLILILVIITNQSCVIVNATKGHDNICYLHGTKMKRTLVNTQFGIASSRNAPTTPNAKIKHSMGCCIPMWPFGRLAFIYHCTTCDSVSHYK